MCFSYDALEGLQVRIPGPDDLVYKDECAYSFSSPETEDGLYVSLHSFIGLSKEFAIQYAVRTSFKAFLHIKRTRTLIETAEKKPLTRLAIGLDGGFQDAKNYDIKDSHQIVILPEGAVFNIDDPKIPDSLRRSVEAVISAESAFTKGELQQMTGTWDGELRKTSKHSANLNQNPIDFKIPPRGWKCADCNLTDNLWLNLTDGSINCGRAFFNGTGGNNHALQHYQKTKNPLVVKLGTITHKGADVYSYDEDDMVVDGNLQEHLAHFGIDMTAMEKTEKSMTELELEMNQRIGEWALCTEEGCELVPLYGPGYTGLVNLGNSCYMNSIVQLLFSLPVFAKKYHAKYPEIVKKNSDDPNTDLTIQMAKLGHAILSGQYSNKSVDGDDRAAYSVKPQCFKNIVGRNHPEFGSKRQQDAEEYFLHLMSLLEKEDPQGEVSESFSFEIEERLQCCASKKVAYKKRKERVLRLNVPMEKADNAGDMKAYEERKKSAEASKEKLDPKDVVLAKLSLSTCIDLFAAPEAINDYYSAATGGKGTVMKTTRMTTMPKYLLVQIRKFTLGEDWRPIKLEVSLDVPDKLDLEHLRSVGGLQPGEEAMPEEEGESTATPPINQQLVEQLVEMGFPVEGCKKAVFYSNNTGAEAAMQWLMDHVGDADLAEPMAPSIASKGSKNAQAPDESKVSMIIGMGFSRNSAVRALRANAGDFERAVEWILTNPEEANAEEVEVPQAELPQVPLDDGPGRYRLTGFVTHMGPNTSSGHYVFHMYKEGRWVICNDEKIAISAKPPRDLAYLYLYSRIDGASDQ